MIKSSIALTIITVAFVLIATDYLDRPYLFISNETKKCAYIELPNGERLGCEAYDQNERYIAMWSK